MPIHFLRPLFLIFVLGLSSWIFYRLLVLVRKKKNGQTPDLKSELILTLFVIYISTVLELTIAPAPISFFGNHSGPVLNIVPVINTYKQFISTLTEPDSTDRDFALENIIGNVILFFPMGIFLPVVYRKINSIKKIAITCFLCSLAIEGTQLLLRRFGTYRTADIDDIILNTIGGIIGWFVFTRLIEGHLFRRANPVKKHF